MTAVVLRGDARRLPLPDACVDVICCSPPYFGLRSYTDTVKCYDCIQMEYAGRDPRQAWPDYDAHIREVHQRHYDGQIGSEATPAEWVAALVACTAEWVRVLKPSGSIFVNLGDKYSSGAGAQTGQKSEALRTPHDRSAGGTKWATVPAQRPVEGVPPKSLLGLPWRYALACMDELGLILRRDIIWSKPNGLPESVTDRCRSSHEYLFHFTKLPRYYAAVDEIREPHVDPRIGSNGRARDFHTEQLSRKWNPSENAYNPLGKLPGSVWEIPSQPLSVPAHLGVDHFAAFPMELPRRVILGWSPPGICTACGEGRRPVSVKEHFVLDTFPDRWATELHTSTRGKTHARGRRRAERDITGYACACPDATAPVRPAVVVDPFGGTGTTALVASMLGRTGISVDLSADYCRLARWRTTDPGERARALQVPKPPPVPSGQGSLFDDLEAS